MIEAAVAVLLLTGLALFASSAHAGSPPNDSAGVSRWTNTALPVLANLITDSRAIERDSSRASTFATAPRRADVDRYLRDLAVAQRLPAPSDAGLAQTWRSRLAQMTSAGLELGALRSANPGAIARAHVRFAAFETVLLEFQQAIRPAR